MLWQSMVILDTIISKDNKCCRIRQVALDKQCHPKQQTNPASAHEAFPLVVMGFTADMASEGSTAWYL